MRKLPPGTATSPRCGAALRSGAACSWAARPAAGAQQLPPPAIPGRARLVGHAVIRLGCVRALHDALQLGTDVGLERGDVRRLGAVGVEVIDLELPLVRRCGGVAAEHPADALPAAVAC